MIAFIAGLMLGGGMGVVTMCLMVAAKEADRHIEDCEYEILDGNVEETKPQGGCPQ